MSMQVVSPEEDTVGAVHSLDIKLGDSTTLQTSI